MKLPQLNQGQPIVDAMGNPAPSLVQWWGNIGKYLVELTNAVSGVSSTVTALSGTSVQKDQTSQWATPTGTFDRTTFATYAGQTVSNPPTQAQVQAIDDQVKALSQHVAALVSDLRGNGTLT